VSAGHPCAAAWRHEADSVVRARGALEAVKDEESRGAGRRRAVHPVEVDEVASRRATRSRPTGSGHDGRASPRCLEMAVPAPPGRPNGARGYSDPAIGASRPPARLTRARVELGLREVSRSGGALSRNCRSDAPLLGHRRPVTSKTSVTIDADARSPSPAGFRQSTLLDEQEPQRRCCDHDVAGLSIFRDDLLVGGHRRVVACEQLPVGGAVLDF